MSSRFLTLLLSQTHSNEYIFSGSTIEIFPFYILLFLFRKKKKETSSIFSRTVNENQKISTTRTNPNRLKNHLIPQIHPLLARYFIIIHVKLEGKKNPTLIQKLENTNCKTKSSKTKQESTRLRAKDKNYILKL